MAQRPRQARVRQDADAPKRTSGFMAKEHRSQRERDEAAKHARSEAPTLPPPPLMSDPSALAPAAERSEAPTRPPPPVIAREEVQLRERGPAPSRAHPTVSGTFKVAREAVVADLRRDPRSEK